MAEQLRGSTSLTEDPSSIPSTFIGWLTTAHKSSDLRGHLNSRAHIHTHT